MTHRLLPKPDAGTNDTVPDDALELKWEFDEDARRYYVKGSIWLTRGGVNRQLTIFSFSLAI